MVPIIKQLIETTFIAGEGNETTLQQQLHARLRSAILEGTLEAGTKLPASRAFAVQQAVSRNTVLAAYDQLVAEGYLETRRGAGTYVAHDLPDAFIKLDTSLAAPSLSPQQTKKRVPQTGLPAIDAFPTDVWARLNSSAWRQADLETLHYNDPMGYRPLRGAIASYLASARNVQSSADQILITSGLQQGLRLIIDSLLNDQNNIILEDPGYDGLLRTARACSPTVSFTQLDDAGACVPSTKSQNSLLVISPSHQYPLGITMPTARRLALINWAQETNSLILEDDYDSEFRYRGRPLNSLQGMSGGEQIIYGGSFSKSMFPSLRLGYLVLPPHLVSQVTQQREATDSFPSIMPQLALTKFISEGHFARHIRRLRKLHAIRQQCYIRCFQSKLCQYFTLIPSSAGLDLVARGTEKLKNSPFNCDKFWANAIQKSGLSALPLSKLYRCTEPIKGLLLGFANFPEDKIETATDKLAQIMLSETGF